MINLISAILFSFSSNLDNIAIGISYGLKKIYIPIFKILIISIFTTLFTFISMILGKYIIVMLNENIANFIGSTMLIILGIYTLIKDILHKYKIKDNKENTTKEIKINFKELMLIILILSTNNIAAGIAASATGINLLITTIFSFIFSFSFILIGNIIGKNSVNKYIQKFSNLISSLLLILIGIITL